jgi:hypothetical protein
MAPWPEQGNEPKAPDKLCSKRGDTSLSDSAKVNSGTTEALEATTTANKTDDKQVMGFISRRTALHIIGDRFCNSSHIVGLKQI